jgi:hypothetical protein
MGRAKINASWHAKHPMPPRATMAQRIAWHRAHAVQCACRPIPKTVQAAMRRAGAPSHQTRRANRAG